jgi:hypothetical protein
MEFIKYQWVMGEPDNSNTLGFCDELYRGEFDGFNNNNQFQVKTNSSVVLANKLTANPYNQITTTDFEFDVIGYDVFTMRMFTLNIGNKTYVFEWHNPFVSPYPLAYDYEQIGDIYYIRITNNGVAVSTWAHILEALNDIIDVNHGTTSSIVYLSPTKRFKIANMPAGSFINDYSWVDNLDSVAPTVNIGQYMHYSNNALHFGLTLNPEVIKFKFEQAFVLGKYYVLKYNYTSIPFQFTADVTVTNGLDTHTFSAVFNNTSGVLRFPFLATHTDTYDITIEITDTSTPYPPTVAVQQGLVITGISIERINVINTVEYEDCDRNITSPEWTLEQEFDVSVIRLEDAYPNVFRIIVTDNESNSITSRWYKVIADDDCERQYMYKIRWRNQCNSIGDLVYFLETQGYSSNQVNELLLTGVLKKTELDELEKVDTITSSGKRLNIYRNIQATYDLELHPYLSNTFEQILEGIFLHDNVTIEDVEYNSVGVIKVSEMDIGVYTSKIELYKTNTNMIIKKCC